MAIPTPIRRPVGRPSRVMVALAKVLQQVADEIQREMKRQGIEATGNAQDMEVIIYRENLAGIIAADYLPFALQGREAGGMPPVERIEAWLDAKGISPEDVTKRQLAWAIAKSIQASGTKAKDRVPDSFIDRVTDQALASELEELGDALADEVIDAIDKTFKK